MDRLSTTTVEDVVGQVEFEEFETVGGLPAGVASLVDLLKVRKIGLQYLSGNCVFGDELVEVHSSEALLISGEKSFIWVALRVGDAVQEPFRFFLNRGFIRERIALA